MADFLTLSRAIIGIIILSLSFAGKNAYLAVLTLTLIGAVTDILDGKAARHYFGENREGKLGKHDVDIDTFFVLCILGYFSLSGIIVYNIVSLGWICSVIIVIIISRRNRKVMVISEVITVIAFLIVALIYSPLIFGITIAPVMTAVIIINWRRVRYLVFEHWPSMFLK